MVNVSKNVIKTANGFLLLFNGQQDRFDGLSQQMLREVEAMFGKEFWDHVILGFSFWKYDESSIFMRNISGKTEDWKINDMNEQLKTKFHIDQDLDGVFIDSYAKFFPNDVSQQEAFTRETS